MILTLGTENCQWLHMLWLIFWFIDFECLLTYKWKEIIIIKNYITWNSHEIKKNLKGEEDTRSHEDFWVRLPLYIRFVFINQIFFEQKNILY